MSEEKKAFELKDEELKQVAGGLSPDVLDECERLFEETKDLINAYETILSGNTSFGILKNSFNSIVDDYRRSDFYGAYNKTISLKNYLDMYRNRGEENLRKFVSDLENNVLGIDYFLRQFCTNYK